MATFQELKDKEEAQEIFNQVKLDGSRLLREGKIDKKTYYAKTRKAGIELGLIDPNEYPGRLPAWVESAFEIGGGIAGTIGGAIAGSLPGAVAGATGGTAAGSLAYDYLGDLLAPDMPSPSTKERFIDAGITGATSGALTAVAPVVAKPIEATVRGIASGFKSGSKFASDKIKGVTPSADKSVGVVERGLGITDDAVAKANLLGKEGVELSVGQASSSPLIQGAYNLTSRMPIVGKPGLDQMRKSFGQIDEALKKRTKIDKPLTESERSDLINKFGKQKFDEWRKSYQALYKQADDLNIAKGDFFDASIISSIANNTIKQKSKLAVMPKDVTTTLKKIKKLKDKQLAFKDVDALDTRLTDLAKKYDPARSQIPNNTAYQAVIRLQKQLSKQLKNPNDEAGILYQQADEQFASFMKFVDETSLGREFQKTVGRGALRPGIGKPPIKKAEDLYKNAFGENKSPQAIKELRELIGDEQVDVLAANYLDDIFTKYIRSDKRNFTKLYDELGFSNKSSLNYEATKELLKTYKNTSVKDLENFLGAIKQFPEILPDVNTFIMRSGALRAASNLGPSAVVGAAGAGSGVAGVGLLYVVNRFLAQPFNKELVKKAVGNNKSAMARLMERFRNFLPQSLPGGASQELTPQIGAQFLQPVVVPETQQLLLDSMK
jgi:hypothetical protein